MNANLVLLASSGKQKVIPLSSNVTVIGRRHNCDLRIPLEGVSRRHCQLNAEEQQVTLRDLGSRNGTFLNGKKIEEENLKAGDYIQISDLMFAIQIDGHPEKIVPPQETSSTADDSDNTAVLDSDDMLDDLEGLGDLDDLGELGDSELDLEKL